jgi:aspartate racemase
MSWESSAQYYRLLNLLVRKRLGGHANAKSLLLTVNFAEIERLQHEKNWDELASRMQIALGNSNLEEQISLFCVPILPLSAAEG